LTKQTNYFASNITVTECSKSPQVIFAGLYLV